MALPVLSSSAVKFRRVLAQFPQELSLAFAYGSGVFRQAGAPSGHGENNMLDFVFAVDDSVTWHMMNLLKNRSHYSFLKVFGPKQISSIQSYGAGIYYNTLVPCNGRMIKYGVISTDTLIDDLLHWKTLYVAGRLQKPVKILTQSENSRLQAALVSNLKSAVTAAFLMLPESFSEEDLYLQIAGLSYSGDFRMVIGEDRSKVQNIVKPNVPHFQKLYSNILQDCPQVVYKHHLGRLEIDKSPEGQFAQLMALPRTLQQKITSLVNPPGKNRDVEEILLQVAHDPDCGFVVHQGISGIVRPSSIVQSAKTILTAGHGLHCNNIDCGGAIVVSRGCIPEVQHQGDCAWVFKAVQFHGFNLEMEVTAVTAALLLTERCLKWCSRKESLGPQDVLEIRGVWQKVLSKCFKVGNIRNKRTYPLIDS